MSAWMFDVEEMHRVIAAINYAAKNGCPTPITLLMPSAGHALMQMNSAAIHARYAETPYVKGYKNKAIGPLSEMQMFKTLSCFMYQCAEGQVPETTLFKEVQAIEEWFGKRVGYNADADRFDSPKRQPWATPEKEAEYNACKWG